MTFKGHISLAILAAALLQGLAVPSDLSAFKLIEVKKGGDKHHDNHHDQHHTIYYYPNYHRNYSGYRYYDNDYYRDDDDQGQSNFRHLATSSIKHLKEEGDDRTHLELSNGMDFELQVQGMGWKEGMTVNVFSKEDSKGFTEYFLRIDGLDFEANPAND
ncbi:MAG: hypothetical protein KDK78_05680 [Chlamydiia bacterium]|nr:hypothetical protein [Chlamydiia bacterium]